MTTLTKAFDDLDEANGERIGGPDILVGDVLVALEAHILSMRADGPEPLAWKVRQLARAVSNGWDEVQVLAIADSIGRDITVMTDCVRERP